MSYLHAYSAERSECFERLVALGVTVVIHIGLFAFLTFQALDFVHAGAVPPPSKMEVIFVPLSSDGKAQTRPERAPQPIPSKSPKDALAKDIKPKPEAESRKEDAVVVEKKAVAFHPRASINFVDPNSLIHLDRIDGHGFIAAGLELSGKRDGFKRVVSMAALIDVDGNVTSCEPLNERKDEDVILVCEIIMTMSYKRSPIADDVISVAKIEAKWEQGIFLLDDGIRLIRLKDRAIEIEDKLALDS